MSESHSILALQKGLQIPRAVDEHDDVDFVVVDDSLNQPVTAGDDQFPQPFISALGNDPTSLRELTK